MPRFDKYDEAFRRVPIGYHEMAIHDEGGTLGLAAVAWPIKWLTLFEPKEAIVLSVLRMLAIQDSYRRAKEQYMTRGDDETPVPPAIISVDALLEYTGHTVKSVVPILAELEEKGAIRMTSEGITPNTEGLWKIDFAHVPNVQSNEDYNEKMKAIWDQVKF